MSIYQRVFRYYRSFLPQTVAGLILSLIGIALNLLKPWPFKIIVDNLLRPGAKIFWLDNVLYDRIGDVISPVKLDVLIFCLALVVIQFLWGITNWATNYILVKV